MKDHLNIPLDNEKNKKLSQNCKMEDCIQTWRDLALLNV